ncbi:MAG: hypothetical protein QF890_00920 [Myxococcota bacterium]|jgi:hypothetical protein|nr:hypothetical protein [Deltaproteobacteria bacterium]MCP4244255.1 hypothetical protein [bacterium]MDP6074604.1 hypothetical protein [Myxococcota bacterium]MDP6244494.1 hypothetical protein [Myxococcota bacterium]MDP7074272.1 hypothetical protein [Myxococcota bacterium]
MHRRTIALLIALSTTFATGCVAPLFIEMFKDPMGRHDSLVRAQREYTNALRWGNTDAAVSFVHPDLRENFVSELQKFKEIRVTDYDVGKIQWGEEQATATLVVTYHAYSLSSMLEQEIRETQHWERLSGEKLKNDWVVRPAIEELIDKVANLR